MSAPDISVGASEPRIALRPLSSHDEEFFRRVELDPVQGRRYRLRGLTPSPEAYHSTLWSNVLAQQVICRSADLLPFGLVCAYNPDLRNGHCRLAVVLTPHAMALRYPIRGVGEFIDHLFATFPLRKVYAEVMDWNMAPLESLVDGGAFTSEGRLVEFEYFDGSYHDCHILATTAERWREFRLKGRSRPGPTLIGRDALRSHLATMLDRALADLVDDAALIDDLGLDSLEMTELLAFLEDRRGPLPDELIESIALVADVLDLALPT